MANAIDRGLALLDMGQPDEARRILGREARNNRIDGDAQHAYGVALHRSGQFAEAIEQFQRADRLLPGRWQVHQNLSAAYHGLEAYEDAYRHAARVLELRPNDVHALYHLADLHLIWGEMDRAAPIFERVVALDPRHVDGWTSLLFALDLLPGVSPERALDARKRCARAFEDVARPHRRPHRQSADPNRPLRVGFLSGDFRDHTAAYMWGPIYQYADRDRFQLFSYASIRAEDSVGAWLRQMSNGWRAFWGISPRAVADQIRADEIDVLVDTAGYTNGGHLPVFAYRPAPVQLQAFGYLTGSGLSTMDAILVDDVLVPPEHAGHFVERPVRVPYALGFGGLKGELPILPRPEGRPLTFGHLGRSDKATEAAVALWARVLRAYPESRMLLKDRAFRMERQVARVRGYFEAEGIAAERVEIRGPTPRGDHLLAYNEIDVVLDSVPQGGGTTTIEALYMGTPVVTTYGPRIIGRIAATTLHAVGHADWCADDEAGYVHLAGQLAGQGGERLRDEIVGSVVFDGHSRTRAFEAALTELWDEYCARARAA